MSETKDGLTMLLQWVEASPDRSVDIRRGHHGNVVFHLRDGKYHYQRFLTDLRELRFPEVVNVEFERGIQALARAISPEITPLPPHEFSLTFEEFKRQTFDGVVHTLGIPITPIVLPKEPPRPPGW